MTRTDRPRRYRRHAPCPVVYHGLHRHSDATWLGFTKRRATLSCQCCLGVARRLPGGGAASYEEIPASCT
ncbi:hypothetical protein E2C01_007391 [Portunus trituberculatus]|uniref:Uncharacterized protein n=1 Tax=Portunus trituberculatus TaxID=210409 RepID=A0A5B7D468_PORTR|nr:hypothetical protein [Portunus trituberculatus]